MLSIKNLQVSFNRNTPMEKRILNELSLEVSKGEFVAILGGNGAGKSTLLRSLSGEITPDAGKIIFSGQNITTMPQEQKSKYISIVMQDPKISTIENMTILENMSLALMRSSNRGFALFNSAKRKNLIVEKLKILQIGLESRLNEPVSVLSGGQRQALSLCMAILGQCDLLLLDEICAALDPNMSEFVMALTHKIVKENNITSLMITHDMNHALKYGDKIAVISQGKIKKIVLKEEIKTVDSSQLAKYLL